MRKIITFLIIILNLKAIFSKKFFKGENEKEH